MADRSLDLVKDCSSAGDIDNSITTDGYWICRDCNYKSGDSSLLCEGCFSVKNALEEPTLQVPAPKVPETRLILVGKTGTGKSATGNTLLGKTAFRSEISCGSVSNVCQMGRRDRFGRTMLVVDTPGLFDTEMDNESVTKEILKCIGLSAPGPHAILLVLNIGRFTEEENAAVKLLESLFGEDMKRYIIIIFTRKDELDRGNTSIADLVREAPVCLRMILESCDYRFVTFNNLAKGKESDLQVQDLLQQVDKMVLENNSGYYSSDIFTETEKVLQEREREVKEQYTESVNEKLYEIQCSIASQYENQLQENRQKQAKYWEELRQHREYKRKSEQFLQTLSKRQSNNALGLPSNAYQRSNTDELCMRLNDCEEQLQRLQAQEKDILCTMKMTFQARETELKEKLEDMKNNVRDDVRAELKEGKSSILKRIWRSIITSGKGFVGKFKHIFESRAK